MKIRNSAQRFLTGSLCALLAIAATARAEDMVRYKNLPAGSKVRIDGKANVHSWAMEGPAIVGTLELPASVVLDSSKVDIAGAADGKIAAKVDLYIRVNSINNIHNYDGMDTVMQEAMKATDYPKIQFRLNDLTLKQPHTAGTPFQFDAKGELSLAGVTNKIAMPVTIENQEDGKLKVVGSNIPVKMTDFNIKPPVKYGLFTTESEVAISFDWLLGPPKPAAK